MPRVKVIPDEQVLDAAVALLTETGLTRFTLPALAAASGLSAATLIQRFGSKAALIEAALDRATDQLEAQVRDLVPHESPREGLLAWMGAGASALGERGRLASQLELLARDISDDTWRARAARHLALFREGLALHLRCLGSQTPDRHAEELEVLFHGLAIQWGVHGEGALADWMRCRVEQWLADHQL